MENKKKKKKEKEERYQVNFNNSGRIFYDKKIKKIQMMLKIDS